MAIVILIYSIVNIALLIKNNNNIYYENNILEYKLKINKDLNEEYKYFKPLSQCLPVYPSTHVHACPLSVGLQVPPLAHTTPLHGSSIE